MNSEWIQISFLQITQIWLRMSTPLRIINASFESYDQVNESIVTTTTITLPVNGGAVEAVSTIETVPYWTRSRKSGNIFLKYLHIYFKALQQYLYLRLYPYSRSKMDWHDHDWPVRDGQWGSQHTSLRTTSPPNTWRREKTPLYPQNSKTGVWI